MPLDAVHVFRLDQQGLSRVIGPLEAEIMEAVWTRGEATIADVHAALGGVQRLAFNTVMTVMIRLADKGLLRRERRGRAYRFTPALSREAFVAECSRSVAEGLLRDFGSVAAVEFARAAAELTPEMRSELQRILQEGRRE